jgi:lipoprotein-anchoring transpeptidase ErfK/SrfK
MPKFATSLLSSTGLLLVTLLAVAPTRLHAEPNSQKTLDSRPQTLTAPKTPSNPAATLVPALPASGQKSLTGASLLTPGNAVTNNQIPTAGQKPTAKPVVAATSQPPTADAVKLILKLKEKKVYVYNGSTVIAKYPVAVGKKGWETPTGEWYVMEKIANPAWTNFKNGTVISAGSKNPLGERWIGFWTDGKDVIGFHGTPDTKSVGKAVSHGCVRMFDKDVKALFPLVKVGTTVKVVNE